MLKALDIFDIFSQQIVAYHKTDSVYSSTDNPYCSDEFKSILWNKSFIDTVQWHLEDLIRPEDVDPIEALKLKRWIDKSNQNRTDLVERIDDFYMNLFSSVKVLPDAKINTETPAWAIDRLSILALKIYHFGIEINRTDVSQDHHLKCQTKYDTLLTQKCDLCSAIDDLLLELSEGKKLMKLYRQMKMYNDPSLNPMLYNKSNH